ncbi:unnamed protein product, partial [marine sediment metagenome]
TNELVSCEIWFNEIKQVINGLFQIFICLNFAALLGD